MINVTWLKIGAVRVSRTGVAKILPLVKTAKATWIVDLYASVPSFLINDLVVITLRC